MGMLIPNVDRFNFINDTSVMNVIPGSLKSFEAQRVGVVSCQKIVDPMPITFINHSNSNLLLGDLELCINKVSFGRIFFAIPPQTSGFTFSFLILCVNIGNPPKGRTRAFVQRCHKKSECSECSTENNNNSNFPGGIRGKQNESKEPLVFMVQVHEKQVFQLVVLCFFVNQFIMSSLKEKFT